MPYNANTIGSLVFFARFHCADGSETLILFNADTEIDAREYCSRGLLGMLELTELGYYGKPSTQYAVTDRSGELLGHVNGTDTAHASRLWGQHQQAMYRIGRDSHWGTPVDFTPVGVGHPIAVPR